MINRQRVYIAGPITSGDLCHNVNQATAAFIALAKAGFAPHCPHWSIYSKPAEWINWPNDPPTMMCDGTDAGYGVMDHAAWLACCLPWVAASAAVLRLPGESRGAEMECAHARERGIPIFDSIEALAAHFEADTAKFDLVVLSL